uniref:Uncharacterized protein n=1 Tax=Rhizophora mucronata TaxID=61149 RepID=A0A2P2JVN0_RHIMU
MLYPVNSGQPGGAGEGGGQKSSYVCLTTFSSF